MGPRDRGDVALPGPVRPALRRRRTRRRALRGDPDDRRDRDPARLGLPGAPNVHVTTWAAHDELLPRCDVVVTTGGAGSVMACVARRRADGARPDDVGQARPRARMVDAGVAVRLSPRRCTPERCARPSSRCSATRGSGRPPVSTRSGWPRRPGPTVRPRSSRRSCPATAAATGRRPSPRRARPREPPPAPPARLAARSGVRRGARARGARAGAAPPGGRRQRPARAWRCSRRTGSAILATSTPGPWPASAGASTSARAAAWPASRTSRSTSTCG